MEGKLVNSNPVPELSVGEAEAGTSLVGGKPEPYGETLPQNKINLKAKDSHKALGSGLLCPEA